MGAPTELGRGRPGASVASALTVTAPPGVDKHRRGHSFKRNPRGASGVRFLVSAGYSLTMQPEQPCLTRDQLVGKWQKLSSLYEFRPDGTATITTNGEVEDATWEWVDPRHWKLRLPMAPDASIRGLENGAVYVDEFEVIEAGPTHFRATKFDYEFDFLFSRVG
jgi:hypothetical protein